MEFNSAGIIPLIKEKGEWRIFLIQNLDYPEYWSCPKGHLESSEDPETAARRELKEETNLEIKCLLQHSPIIETFIFTKNGKHVLKRILFYLAEVKGEVILQKDEALDGKWFSLTEAIAVTKHPEGKETLLQVKKILNC